MKWTIFDDYSHLAKFDHIIRILRRKLKIQSIRIHLICPERAYIAKKLGLLPANDVNLCAYTISDNSSGVFLVSDTLQHPILNCHPAVQSGDHVRFYAGCTITCGAHVYGSLCVQDIVPRIDFNRDHCSILHEFSLLIADVLQFHMDEEHRCLLNGVYMHQSILGVLQTPTDSLLVRMNQLSSAICACTLSLSSDFSPQQSGFPQHIQSLEVLLQWFQQDLDYAELVLELSLRSLTHIAVDHSTGFYTDNDQDLFYSPTLSFASRQSAVGEAQVEKEVLLERKSAAVVNGGSCNVNELQEKQKERHMTARRASLLVASKQVSLLSFDNTKVDNNCPRVQISTAAEMISVNPVAKVCLFRKRLWVAALHRLLRILQQPSEHSLLVTVDCSVSLASPLLLSFSYEILLLAVSLCLSHLRYHQLMAAVSSTVRMTVETLFSCDTQMLEIKCWSEAFQSAPISQRNLQAIALLVDKLGGGCVTVHPDAIILKLPAVLLLLDLRQIQQQAQKNFCDSDSAFKSMADSSRSLKSCDYPFEDAFIRTGSLAPLFTGNNTAISMFEGNGSKNSAVSVKWPALRIDTSCSCSVTDTSSVNTFGDMSPTQAANASLNTNKFLNQQSNIFRKDSSLGDALSSRPCHQSVVEEVGSSCDQYSTTVTDPANTPDSTISHTICNTDVGKEVAASTKLSGLFVGVGDFARHIAKKWTNLFSPRHHQELHNQQLSLRSEESQTKSHLVGGGSFWSNRSPVSVITSISVPPSPAAVEYSYNNRINRTGYSAMGSNKVGASSDQNTSMSSVLQSNREGNVDNCNGIVVGNGNSVVFRKRSQSMSYPQYSLGAVRRNDVNIDAVIDGYDILSGTDNCFTSNKFLSARSGSSKRRSKSTNSDVGDRWVAGGLPISSQRSLSYSRKRGVAPLPCALSCNDEVIHGVTIDSSSSFDLNLDSKSSCNHYQNNPVPKSSSNPRWLPSGMGVRVGVTHGG